MAKAQDSQISNFFLTSGREQKLHESFGFSNDPPVSQTSRSRLVSKLSIDTCESDSELPVLKWSMVGASGSSLGASVGLRESPSAFACTFPALCISWKSKSVMSSDHRISFADRFLVERRPITAAESVIRSKDWPAR
jgi:hypothetical protein